jgi:hypothetical protein
MGLTGEVADGLTLENGRVLGLGVVLGQLHGDGWPDDAYSGTWASIFEPYKLVDIRLAGGVTALVNEDVRGAGVVAGRVHLAGGAGVSGIELRLQSVAGSDDGGNTRMVTTNEQGEYIFKDLKDGRYLVRPVSDEYHFDPESREVTLDEYIRAVESCDFIAHPNGW